MKSSTRVLLSLAKQNKKVYVADAIAMFIANATIALMPIFFGLAAGTAAIGDDYGRAGTYLLLGFVMNAIHWATWHIGDYIVSKHVLQDMYKIRDKAYRVTWGKPYSEFIEKPSSKVAAAMGRLHEEAFFTYHSVHFGTFSILVYYIVLLLSVTALSWQNGLVYILFMAVSLTILRNRVKILSKAQSKTADQLAEKNGKIYDDISNFTNVFSFNTKSKEITKTSRNNRSLYRTHKKSEFKVVAYWVSASFMMRIVLWAILLSMNFWLLSSGRIDQAAFAAAISVLITFTNDYWSMVHHIGQFGGRYAAFSQNYTYLFDDMNILEVDDPELPKADSKVRTAGASLSLRNISFAYPDAPDVQALRGVNLDIQPGEKIGIVGMSGGGKSTLVKLLLGFYQPISGTITLDGDSVSGDQLSEAISYVPQDTALFQESISYNIGYAIRGSATQDQIVEAAKKAHADSFIRSLQNGYETLVGERGVKLSLGQRQRIAIARAFLKDTDILVLDEATSSLDSRTEADIQDSLEKLWQGKTVIAIAHRLSTLNNVDRIVVIDKGRIVETGTKKELLANKGHFAKLWKQQKDGLI